ncbi:MAG: phosphatase PAP2 family protein [Proteobacteria bacterium]|nr:phosphatase PAP2 family protein [Pseudomonadota bacterium]
MKKSSYAFLILIFTLILISFLGLDIKIAHLFYIHGAAVEWPYSQNRIWLFFYNYGAVLPDLIGATAIVLLIVSFFAKGLKPWRKKLIFAVLLIAIAPGLITQTLKTTWGRPRPIEITEFGGKYNFRTPFHPDFSMIGNTNDGNSFPSGHAAIGFYILVLYYIFNKRKRFLLAGLAYGGVMAFGRMAQGAHFFSDVLTSWFIVYITAEALSKILVINKDQI